MNKKLITLYSFLSNRTPQAIKQILKFFRFQVLVSIFIDKHDAGLAFQAEWVKEFKDKKHVVLEYWERYRFLNEIKTIVDIHEDTKILDVGCGISTVLHFLNGKRYGIDPLAESYKSLYKFPEDIQIQKAEGENIPFADNYFDIVFCSNVIDHVSDPQKVIDNVFRVLNTDGYFVLTVELFNEHTSRGPTHPHSLTKVNIVNLFGNKFKIVFERESPWIGMRNYLNKKKKYLNNELIIVLQKL